MLHSALLSLIAETYGILHRPHCERSTMAPPAAWKRWATSEPRYNRKTLKIFV